MKIPGTTKSLIENILDEHKISVKKIARAINVTPKTIHQILNGATAHSETDIKLLVLYLQLKFWPNKRNALLDRDLKKNDRFSLAINWFYTEGC